MGVREQRHHRGPEADESRVHRRQEEVQGEGYEVLGENLITIFQSALSGVSFRMGSSK